MIYPLTGWFEVTQYNNKRVTEIANLVEITWLSRYPRPMDITYDQGKQFIGHEFRKFLIEMEYGITFKPSTLVNPINDAILKHVHQFIGNLVLTCNITQTYDDKDDPWSGILDAAAFVILSTTNRG